MRRAVLLLVLATALVAAVSPSAISAASSASTVTDNRAAVVVELPSGETRSACVLFKEPSITGLDLLIAAQMEPATYGMGQGAAVCKLCGEGCPTTRSGCLSCEGGKYWQYYRSDGGATFQYSNVGAGNSSVTDGDVDGWTFDSSRKEPLLVAVETVCSDPARTFRYEPSSSPPSTTEAPSPSTTAPSSNAPATTAAPSGGGGPVASPATGARPANGQPAPSDHAAPSTTVLSVGSAGSSTEQTTTTASALGASDRGSSGRADQSAAGATAKPIANGRGSSSVAASVLFAALLAGVVGWTVRLRRARRPAPSP